jgi:hypothetical protein
MPQDSRCASCSHSGTSCGGRNGFLYTSAAEAAAVRSRTSLLVEKSEPQSSPHLLNSIPCPTSYRTPYTLFHITSKAAANKSLLLFMNLLKTSSEPTHSGFVDKESTAPVLRKERSRMSTRPPCRSGSGEPLRARKAVRICRPVPGRAGCLGAGKAVFRLTAAGRPIGQSFPTMVTRVELTSSAWQPGSLEATDWDTLSPAVSGGGDLVPPISRSDSTISPSKNRQTLAISFIEISIEAGILLGGKHEACFVLGMAGIEPMPS